MYIFFFRDEKQIDLAEQLESVAYVLCGDDKVSLDKFCQILQAKGVRLKFFSMLYFLSKD